jgi:hypothetical protein
MSLCVAADCIALFTVYRQSGLGPGEHCLCTFLYHRIAARGSRTEVSDVLTKLELLVPVCLSAVGPGIGKRATARN